MITWKQLCQAVVGASPAAVYTAPASTATAIHQASAWNPSGGAVQMRFYIVPNGGTAADATTLWAATIPATSSAQLPQMIGHKLQAGQSLYASGPGVTLTISGAENVQ